MLEEAGLPVAERLDHVPNSRRALILGEVARAHGAYEQLHPRLFHASGRRVATSATRRFSSRRREAAGLDGEDVRAAFAEERHLDSIERSTKTLFELGAGGVPAWMVDERLLVPGAQPHDVFDRVLERLGHQILE